jgi:hypothetical protein
LGQGGKNGKREIGTVYRGHLLRHNPVGKKLTGLPTEAEDSSFFGVGSYSQNFHRQPPQFNQVHFKNGDPRFVSTFAATLRIWLPSRFMPGTVTTLC